MHKQTESPAEVNHNEHKQKVISSLQATVIKGLLSFQAMCSIKRDLPQPVGPLSIIGIRAL